MEALLHVNHLEKNLDEFVLKDVNLTLQPGYIMGLIGVNGTGKTTLIQTILNLYKKFNIFNRPSKKCYQKVRDIFEILNIENLLHIPFNQLSGGQAQKVMIARAMVNNPEVLLLDEPTVGVDEKSKRDFLKLLAYLNDKHKISILMISHEMDVVREFSKREIRIKNGRIVDA